MTLPDFDDGKSPDALRTIGEVTRALGIRQHVLRYWEEQFTMLAPVKRSGGRRYYRPEDIALIVEIDRLVHQEGFTLRGARQLIEARAGEGRAVAGKSALPERAAEAVVSSPSTADAFLSELKAIRADLAEALAAA